MSDRLRILFALPFLSRIGGSERVMVTLLQRLDRRRFEPVLAVLDGQRNELANELPDDVQVIDLEAKRARWAARPLIATLQRLRPAVLLSNLGHLNLMIAMLRPILPRHVALVGRETSLVTSLHEQYRTARLRNAAYRKFYPNLDLVICQSTGMRDDLEKNLGFPAARLRLVPNPVDIERVQARAALIEPAADILSRPSGECRPFRLVAVGRLTEAKGFDLLIDAAASLPRDLLEVFILGEGPDRDELAARIVRRGVQDRVHLLGFQANPHAFIARSDALVLSSRFEGLPNVVLEAIALGRPVIATPCPGGLSDIAASAGGIRIASAISSSALAEAIEQTIKAPDRTAGDISSFQADTITRRYESVLMEAARARAALVGKP